jgi:hypothetical protein
MMSYLPSYIDYNTPITHSGRENKGEEDLNIVFP